jgi:hypothetical protein
MDPRIKTSTAGLEEKFQLEERMAALLSQTSETLMQAESIGPPLQKLSQQASGAIRDSVQAFQTKLATVLGAPAGFAAPPIDEVTLSRVNGQVAVLYGQVWPADAEPTASQSEALAAIEHDALDVLKRWNALKTADIPALNRMLNGANLPELHLESDLHKEETVMDED